jgi:hypothetical protein
MVGFCVHLCLQQIPNMQFCEKIPLQGLEVLPALLQAAVKIPPPNHVFIHLPRDWEVDVVHASS